MTDILYRFLFIVLILRLLLTMYQRRYTNNGGKKRLLSLYQSLLLGFAYVGSSVVLSKGYNQNFIYVVIIITIILGWILRNKIFIYPINCEKCQKRLSLKQILFLDSQICQKCKI